MEIKVESKIKVEVGDVTLKLKREEAYQLYNALKTELGITNYDWTWPYQHPSYPYYTYPYVSCQSVLSDGSEYNSSGVVTVTSSASANSVSIHPDNEEIDEFLTSVKEYNSL